MRVQSPEERLIAINSIVMAAMELTSAFLAGSISMDEATPTSPVTKLVATVLASRLYVASDDIVIALGAEW